MKILDIISLELSGRLGAGELPGITLYIDSPEDAAILNELENENKERYCKIEAVFNKRVGHSEEQFFRAGLAMGLQLAAETFNGLTDREDRGA